MSYLTLVPAFGRDYTSKKSVLEAWNKNMLFRIATFGPLDGKTASKSDLESAGYKSVHIRYKRLTMVTIVKVSP